LAQGDVSSQMAAPYKILARKSSAKIAEPPKEKQPLGQAHSPAIEPHLKIAPLAGLFRPTGRRHFIADFGARLIYQSAITSTPSPFPAMSAISAFLVQLLLFVKTGAFPD
jgi:hypothetical protein